MGELTRRNALALSGAALASTARAAGAATTVSLRVVVFPGISNLSLFAAQANGYFAERGLEVQIHNTRSSDELRDGLASGEYQVAHAGVDNAVAMVESAGAEVAVVIGGHGGFGQLLVRPGIDSLQQVRGQTVVVDSPGTAYALVLYKILADQGLKRGDYQVHAGGGTASALKALLDDPAKVASIISAPFSFTGEKAGLKNLGPVRAMIGAFQFDAGFVLRAWARQNSDVLTRYLQGYIKGCRWVLDPGNRPAATALLVNRLRLDPAEAARVYDLVVDRATGFSTDARLDVGGFRKTLELRAEIAGQWGGQPPEPERYIDQSYYDRALREL